MSSTYVFILFLVFLYHYRFELTDDKWLNRHVKHYHDLLPNSTTFLSDSWQSFSSLLLVGHH